MRIVGPYYIVNASHFHLSRNKVIKNPNFYLFVTYHITYNKPNFIFILATRRSH